MALAHAIGPHTPLVQFPPSGVWGHGGNPVQIMADSWLGEPLAVETDPRPLALRYLAAFGPATVMDMLAVGGNDAAESGVRDLAPGIARLPQ